ncbi:MAG: hypothetical protein P8Y80_14710 [Acidobacteriota bacterium]|jgi:hypothetical protein
MFCPKCKAEYREGYSKCTDCDIDLVPELPPEPGPSHVDYVDFIKIRTYYCRQDADLAKSFLSANGLQAVVFSDDAGGIHHGLSFSRGVHLMVQEEDVEKAKEILSDSENRN